MFVESVEKPPFFFVCDFHPHCFAQCAMLRESMASMDECTPHLNPHGLRICETKHAGRSVFATREIPSNTIIEISPVLLFAADEYELHGKHTLLDSYTFVWEKSTAGNTMALALGLGSLFNHDPVSANVSYELDKPTRSIRYRTVRHIHSGEELNICYGTGRMWWESPREERPLTPVSESHELALFGEMEFNVRDEASSHRAPVNYAYKAPLWRVTTSPDPKTMALETALAWAINVPAKACSKAAQAIKTLVKNGTLRAGDAYPKYSIRHLRSFRKSSEVVKDHGEALEHGPSDLSMFLCLEEAHTQLELASLLSNSLCGVVPEPFVLYRVRVPTSPAPSAERLPEWSAVWPCVYLPPGAGIASKNGVPGSDAARAIVPVDRDADARLWSDPAAVDCVRSAFRRCLASARRAQAAGEVGVGVFVTDMQNDGFAVDAHDTRVSEAHPLRHAIVNAVRRVADVRSCARIEERTSSENGQDYLLTGLTLFITHEPCVYCSMALIHSRVQSVYFLYPSPQSGGFCGAQSSECALCEGGQDGGPFAIHEQSGLNHKYDVWRWIDPAEFDDEQVDASLNLDV